MTQSWIRNRSDEIAVENGCRFDAERGQAVIDWIEGYCRLYQGTRSAMVLGDWQREATMRMFGWVRWSDRLGRWIRRFTRAGVWIPKKNGKSPTAAAWALYLLMGDGEPGQNVFFAAADGQQARIVAKHALEMVKASPDLTSEIGINLNEMKLTHRPSLSEAKPISSGDNRAARAKQGLNGSVVIDETHVVSREFISESSIDRAGASRDEPMHIEVSTAGKDPDGYGKHQYDYGKQVESGEIEDQAFFFLCYEAPQTLTDEEIDADPVKWGRMANPTWGRIIQEEEYLADYRRSRRTNSDFIDFKTFRLNIWQQSSSPWIESGLWAQCRREFTEDDLLGMECCAGLDLAQTRDMTALVLVFPWGEAEYRVLPYFWLPKAGVKRIGEKVSRIYDWVRDGEIIETEGDECDYRAVKDAILEATRKFSVSMVVFDPDNASHLIQDVQRECGVECLKFIQNSRNYNEPMKEFERLVKLGAMQHNGNRTLAWQMGHVNFEEYNRLIRPVKPKRGDVKKIDGVVSGIMALAGAMKVGHGGGWWKPGMMKD